MLKQLEDLINRSPFPSLAIVAIVLVYAFLAAAIPWFVLSLAKWVLR